MTKNFKLLLEEIRYLHLQPSILYPEKEVIEISNGTKSIIVKEVFSFANDPYSASAVLAKNKEVSYKLWERAVVPFPRSRYFKSPDSFPKNEAEFNLKFPVVVKKSNGKKSIGIRTNITSFEELFEIIKDFQGSFIIQEMVFGKEYRILLYGKKIIGALELAPPQIIGNGVSSIRDLIHEKNSKLENKILLNKSVLETLEKSGFSFESIPEQNKRVLLQENSCLAEGGSSIDCTDEVHPGILDLAIRAADALNMKLAGLDVICEDIRLDPETQKISFLEANSFPSLSIHYFPTVGAPRNVIRDILEDIF